MTIHRKVRSLLLLIACFGAGCAFWDNSNPKKVAPPGLIATPTNYYSTPKARYLGTKYKDNLDRLAERIARNSTTSQLQFANNISSVGGIGFFTHSATKTSDERYLEVVLSTPETFETKADYSEKVNRLFSRFGHDLLAILAGDTQIFQDKELSGYGLNLTWRNVIAESPANRITMARAIIYFDKQRVSSYLRKEVGETELLSDAVIFAVEEDGPLNLVSFQPRETKPDFRPAIREDNLAAGTTESKPSRLSAATQPEKESATAIPIAVAEKPETKVSPPVARKGLPVVTGSAESTKVAAEKLPQAKLDSATEKLAAAKPSAEAAAISPVSEAKPPPVITLPQPSLAKLEEKLPNNKPTEIPTLKPIETEKTAPKLIKETAKPAPSVVLPKASSEGAKTQTADEIKIAPVPVANLPAAVPVNEEKSITPAFEITKLQNNHPPPEPDRVAAPKAVEKPARTAEPAVAPAATSTIEETTRPSADTVAPLPVARVAPLADTPLEVVVKEVDMDKPLVKERPAVAPKAAIAKTPAASEPVAKTLAADPSKGRDASALRPGTEKSSAAELGGRGETPVAEIANLSESKVPASPVARPAPSKSPESAVVPQAKATEAPPARSSVEKSQVAPARGVAKIEPAIKPEAKLPMAASLQENANEKPEQLALLRKPAEPIVEKPAVTRPAPKSLEGFIIQVAFNDKEKAQNWAEKMQQRGYAVSVTEAGTEGSLRVRLGNFALRDEAERQLRNFKQDGMSGIIINLPQAFRPEARSSVP